MSSGPSLDTEPAKSESVKPPIGTDDEPKDSNADEDSMKLGGFLDGELADEESVKWSMLLDSESIDVNGVSLGIGTGDESVEGKVMILGRLTDREFDEEDADKSKTVTDGEPAEGDSITFVRSLEEESVK